MFKGLMSMFGRKEAEEPDNLFDAVIVDVRSPGEFASGHVPGSINIPVQELQARLGELDRARPLITCCASGLRSRVAVRLLEASGYASVTNGGSWLDVLKRAKRLEARAKAAGPAEGLRP
jgi:rhodanese-related sulfurtransferase